MTSWKANALWAKFDKRASHKVYMKGKACAGQRVLVIGAGPCGLRTAIEAQLLGKTTFSFLRLPLFLSGIPCTGPKWKTKVILFLMQSLSSQ